MDLDLVLNRSFPGSINDSIIFYTPLDIILDTADLKIFEHFQNCIFFQTV